MNDLKRIINEFRAFYPTATISCKVAPIDSKYTHISVSIANVDGLLSTVETLSTFNTEELHKAQDESTVRAIEYLGIFVDESSDADEGNPGGKVIESTHTASEESERANLTEKEQHTEDESTPAAEPMVSRSGENTDEPKSNHDEESDDSAPPANGNASPEPGDDEKDDESNDGPTATSGAHKEGSASTLVEESPASESVVQEDGAEVSDALVAALAVVLDITDPTRKVSMKNFIGKPMEEIATKRPAILRNILREADKGNVVCTAECLAAARIIAEAKVGC